MTLGRRVARIATKVVAVVAIVSLAVMLLWNWLMPILFGVKTISYWQALGILGLSKLLFGGLGPRQGPPPWIWRKRILDRYEQMSPEDREKFRQGLQKGWPPFGPQDMPDHSA